MSCAEAPTFHSLMISKIPAVNAADFLWEYHICSIAAAMYSTKSATALIDAPFCL
jgi:hypothetical protein